MFRCPIQGPSLTIPSQTTIAMKTLLGVTALEKLFKQPTSDEEETRIRKGLSRYASGLHSDWMLIPS